MTHASTLRPLVLGVLCALGLTASASAQSLRGRALDDQTGLPLEGVDVRLTLQPGPYVDDVITDSEGRFELVGVTEGIYVVEAALIGYAVTRLQLHLGRGERLTVNLQLGLAAVPIEPLVITARARDPRHDASYEGFLARRSLFPRIGGRRAVLREDLEARTAMRVRDVVRWMDMGARCRVVYVNERLVGSALAADYWINEASVSGLEGLEFYSRPLDAPPVFWGIPAYLEDNYKCNVIVLWLRR